MLNGNETWTIAKAEEKRLLAYEAQCWRRMQKISCREYNMINEVVFARSEERYFIKNLKK